MKDELHYIWQSSKSVRGADGTVSSHPLLCGAGLLFMGKKTGPNCDGSAAEHFLSILSILSTCINLGGCDSLSDVFLEKKVRGKMDSMKNPLPAVNI